MRAARAIALGLLFAVLGPGVSRAALIVLEDARYVYLADATPPTVTPAPGASLFQVEVSGQFRIVNQKSTLGPSELSGTGGIFGEPGCCQVAESVFDVLFTVDAPASFALTMFRFATSPPGPGTMV